MRNQKSEMKSNERAPLSYFSFLISHFSFYFSVSYSRLKLPVTILLLVLFTFVSIIMPYGNFDDNYVTRLLYNEQQKQDPDLNIGEFVFDRLLRIGGLFGDEDDDDAEQLPVKGSHPIQSLNIQAGFLECYKPIIKMQDLPEKIEKPTCFFKDNKFSREFISSIFHPPAIS